MKKKLLALAVLLIMIISLLPLTASAAAPEPKFRMYDPNLPMVGSNGRYIESYFNAEHTVYVMLEDVVDETTGEVLGNKPVIVDFVPTDKYVKYEFDGTTAKITIKNINYIRYGNYGSPFIYILKNTNASSQFNVVVTLLGENSMNAVYDLADVPTKAADARKTLYQSSGQFFTSEQTGTLTIAGPGSLTADCPSGDTAWIWSKFSGDLLIKDATLDLYLPNTNTGTSAAICANGNIVISNSKLDIVGRTALGVDADGNGKKDEYYRDTNNGKMYSLITGTKATAALSDKTKGITFEKGSEVNLKNGSLYVINTNGPITVDRSSVTLEKGTGNHTAFAPTLPYVVGEHTSVQGKIYTGDRVWQDLSKIISTYNYSSVNSNWYYAEGHSITWFTSSIDHDGNSSTSKRQRGFIGYKTVHECQNPGDDGDCTTAVTCSCTSTVYVQAAEAHSFTTKASDVLVEGTTDSYYVKCDNCEVISDTVIISGCEHTEQITLPGVEATCTTAGMTEGKKCASCGKIVVAQEKIEAPGHTEETLPGVAATCTEDGLTEGKKCSVCNEILIAQETISAAHTPIEGETPTCTKGVNCAVCGEQAIAPKGHKVEFHYTGFNQYRYQYSIIPTCTEPGQSSYKSCSVCGRFFYWSNDSADLEAGKYTGFSDLKSMDLYEAPFGHKEGEPVLDEATNEWVTTCTRCNEETKRESAACKHANAAPGEVKDATCTEDGHTAGVYCPDCETWIEEQKTISATNHKNAAPGEAKDATCTEDGHTAGVYCPDCKTWTVEQETIPATKHKNAAPGEAKDATCTEDGHTAGVYCPDCKTWTVEQETIPATKHKNAAPGEAKDATCTEDGHTAGVYCPDCKTWTVEQETIPATKHKNAAPGEAKDATCTEDGHTAGVYCPDCKTWTVEQETIPATKHKNAAPGEAKDATCTEDGHTAGVYCPDCKTWTVEQETIPATKHKNAAPGEAKDATCTEDGHTAGVYCPDCKTWTVEQETIPATKHKNAAPGEAKDATCTEDGHTAGVYCPDCKTWTVEQETIPATKHKNAAPGEAKDATCTEDGHTAGVYCPDCKTWIEEQEPIKAKGHTPGAAVKENETATSYDSVVYCEVCKIQLSRETIPTACAHAHTEEVKGYAATCTEDGLTDGVKCTDCGEFTVKQTVIKAKGHTEQTVKGKDATCTEDGLTDGIVCSVCNVTIKAQETIEAKGHTQQTVKGKDATCTEDGLTDGIVCSVCETTIKAQETIEAKGHTEKTVKGKEATCTEDGLTDGIVCSVCNVTIKAQETIKALGHTEKTVKGKDATCTEDGLTDGIVCSVCQTTIKAQETIQAKGHTPGAAVKENETATSYDSVVYCEVCNKELSRETIPTACAHAHTEEVKGYAATCTEDGLTDGIKCIDCGETIKAQETIQAKGHTEQTVKGKDATCTEDGLTDGIVCSVCETTIKAQETIQAKGHTEKTVKGKDATCTEDGLTDGTVCSVCQTTIKAQETIQAKGHTEKTVKGKEATCTEDGLTDGIVCSVCQTTIKAQETIKAKGHTEQTVKGKEATCTEDGLTDGIVCSVCNVTIKAQETIEAKGHDHKETGYTDPTFEADGFWTYKCHCGDEYTKVDTGSKKIAVATVNDTKYETFAEAWAAAQAGDTVTLFADLKLSQILTIDKAIILDGNGYKLTSTAGRAINVSGADGVVIKNLTVTTTGERAINVIQGATNLTLGNVTATAANYTVNIASSAPNAVVTIKNSTLNGLCTVNVSAAGAKVTVDNSIVNCNDNNTTAGEAYAALSLNKEAVGGSIVATNTTINVAEGSDSYKGRNGAENGTVTINGSTEDVLVIVAVITYEGSNYYHSFASLAEAIEFAKAGDVITLIRDITASQIITIDKAITLDGNGHTLTSTAARAINIDTTGNVVINDLTINAGERAINIINKASAVELNNVTATAKNNAVMIATSAGAVKLTINDSDLTGLAVVNVAGAGAEVEINNTDITNVDASSAENYGAITIWSSAEAANVTVNGGNITVGDDSREAYVFPADATIEGVEDVGYIVATIGDAGFETLEAAIKAAKAGQTIKLVRDITASQIITIDKAVTIDGNGYKLTSTAARAINIDTTGNVVINDLTINAGERAINIINKASTVELNNVTATAKNNAVMIATSAGAVKLTINDSDLTGLAVVNVAGAGAEVEINNTDITNVDASSAENYGAITIWSSAEAANVTVNGGNITVGDDSREAYVFPADATIEGVEDVGYIVATIGDAGFETLEAAIKAAKAGQTIKLVRDITASQIITIDKAVTIDGNGHKLTSTAARAINIDTTGNVVINDLTINAGERAINIINKASTVELNNVTATAKNNAVMIATSAGAVKLTINDSDLTGLAVVNVAGAGAEVEINNTDITNVDASSAENYGAITIWSSAEAANVTVNGGNITVGDDSREAYVFPADAIIEGVEDVGYIVATIGDAGFETLEAAIKAAKAGQTIKLIRDIELTEGVVVPAGKNIVLDLAGYNISLTVAEASKFTNVITNNGTLTIIDSAEEDGEICLTYTGANNSNVSISTIGNYGILNIQGGVINCISGNQNISYAIDSIANSNVEINISGGIVKGGRAGYSIRMFLNSTVNNNVLNVTGGEVGYVWAQNTNANANKASINVTGGYVSYVYVAAANGAACDVSNITLNVKAECTTWAPYVGSNNNIYVLKNTDGIYNIHKHIYTTEVTDPTCTEKGYNTYTCSVCGDTHIADEVAALGHDIVIDKAVAATCTETGLTEGQHCSRCDGATIAQEEVAAKGHKSSKVEVISATCTEDGYLLITCNACGETFDSREEGFAKDYLNGPLGQFYKLAALGHDIVIDKAVAATCTETGLTEGQHCSRCDGATIAQEEVAAKGHKSSKVEVISATCTEDGYLLITCNACGETFDSREEGFAKDYLNGPLGQFYKLAALGHDIVIDKAVAATCTETGLTEGQHCSRCDGATIAQEEVAAKGHKSSKVEVISATCTEDGYLLITCNACGETFDSREEGFAKDYLNGPLGQFYKLAALGHDIVIDKAVAATCTETGLTEGQHCSRCDGATIAQEEVAAKGHKSSKVEVISATCTEDGYLLITCNACGETFDSREEGFAKDYLNGPLGQFYKLAALGHDIVIDKAVAATCTETGLTEGQHCSRCDGATIAQEEVAAKGHAKKTVIENNVAASCTKGGSYDEVVYCTVCEAELSRNTATVPAKGHAYKENVMAPDCYNGGCTIFTCSACGFAYVDNYVPATGHTAGQAKVENTVDPDCINTGSYDEVVYCVDCGAELSRTAKTVAALGHKYESKVTDPDCVNEGYTTYTCSVCGDSYKGNVVPATGHTFDQQVISKMYRKAAATINSKAVFYYACSCGESSKGYANEATFEYGELAGGAVASVDGYNYATFEEAVAAAIESGKEVKLLTNIKNGKAIVINGNVTIDFGNNFYTVNQTTEEAGEAAFVIKSGNVTLKNGKVQVLYAARTSFKYLVVNNGTLTTENATLNGNNLYAEGETYTIVNNGTLALNAGTVVNVRVNGLKGSSNVTKAASVELAAPEGTCWKNETVLSAHIYELTETVNSTCTVEGHKTYTCACGASYEEAIPVIAHTFDQNVVNIKYRKATATLNSKAVYYTSCSCGESSKGYANEATFEYGEFAAGAVAEANGVYYASFAEAIAAVNGTGKEAKLLKDVNNGVALIIDGDVIINLNGHIYTVSQASEEAAMIIKSGNVTVKDGKLQARYSNRTAFKYLVVNNGTLTTENVTLSGNNLYAEGETYTIVNNGTLALNAGTVVNVRVNGLKGSSNVTKAASVELAAPEGTCWKNETVLSAHGYVTTSIPATVYEFSYDLHVCSACGHSYKDNFGTKKLTAIAKIVRGEDEFLFTSLAEALAEAQDGDVVTLLQNVNNGAAIVIEKNLTIDFGGKTYTVFTPDNGAAVVIGAGKDVTLTNGTVQIRYTEREKFHTLVVNSGNLTISDITLKSNNACALDAYRLSFVVKCLNADNTVSATNVTVVKADHQYTGF